MSRPVVERVYAVFRRYPLGKVDGCPCCVDPEEVAALRARGLGDHDERTLGRYYRKSMSTWGTEEDFKHFLPRILELLVTKAPDFAIEIGLDSLPHKLVQAGWRQWPEEERAAVREVLLGAWRELVAAPEGTGDLVAMIEAQLWVIDAEALIAVWEEHLATTPGWRRVAEALIELAPRVVAGDDGVAAGLRTLRAWLLAQVTRLEAAFEADPNDRIAEAVDMASFFPD